MGHPLTEAPVLLTDGGLETTVIFDAGVDLPDFAAFPLVDSASGRTALADYYRPYLSHASSLGLPFVLETPTWRASPDWGLRLGYDRSALRRLLSDAVAFTRGCSDGSVDLVLSGSLGPRGDGYVADSSMTAEAAADYHAFQIRAMADEGVELVTAFTLTSADEAVGIVWAAADAGIPVVIGLTLETNGRLPTGQRLSDAIVEIDMRTDGSTAWFMINCAHTDHVARALDDDAPAWRERVGALRANASTLSHAELDAAPALDRGDPVSLAEGYLRLAADLTAIRVVGGCCGTGIEHVRSISEAWLSRR